MLITAISGVGRRVLIMLKPAFRVLWWGEGGASNSELLEGRLA